MEALQSYLADHRDRYLEELMEWLRIPSISTDSEYKEDIQKAAQWIEGKLLDAGADSAEIIETDGHPIVYAEKIVDENKPTALVYGHYDVQPPDPLDKWDSDPFEPVVRETEIHPEGAIFARGACDDKGQVYMHVKAFEAMVEYDQLPCNIKFMIEGEEEVGSPNLEGFCRNHKEKLACDTVLVSDTSMLSNETPSITTGLRGLSYVEVTVTGPNRDLHSGVYGGAVANPVNILAKMISGLQDEQNRITIPGFYDDVEEVTGEERQKMNEAPFDQEAYKDALGIDEVYGEEGYTTLERTTIRPTLDVNGIWGGYTGEGAKTVLPSEGHAKISMRLVPGQNSEKITELFIDHIHSVAPDAVKVTCEEHHGGEPAITPTDSDEYRAAEYAMKQTFGQSPIPMRSGGSIPIVALFEKMLNVNVVLLGFGLDSDALHSPNEHYGVFNFHRGIETIPYFHEKYAEIKT